ncbi:hypothetical protein HMPREF3183_01518, partial [Peptostreptococcus anaerobius]
TYPFIIFDKIAGILKNSLVSVTYVLTTKKKYFFVSLYLPCTQIKVKYKVIVYVNFKKKEELN